MKNLILQIGYIVLGLIISYFITTLIIPIVTDDTKRLTLINKWSNDDDLIPEIVIFGDSKAMTGIDGYLISKKFNNASVASFTSLGQSLSESALFYPKLKEGTKVVIQCLDVNKISKSLKLNNKKASRLILTGFEYDPNDSSLLSEKAQNTISANKLLATYNSKSFLKQGIHTYLRTILEPNALSENIYDLTYPYLYNYERAPQKEYDKFLRNYSNRKIKDTLKINKEVIEKLILASQYFRSKNVEFVIVFMPFSPIGFDYLPKDYSKKIKEFQKEIGVKVLDYTNLLQDEYFVDPTHPNRAGAKIITEKMVHAIKDNQNN
ncbi:SGNH/GDSL hydrolase family protein [Brumimicrobium mesophilum]|uniref:hypothetical protein n=1 Tax=Brumimicrobium mesophilum TaxID=392717 RepID=UPI00131C1AED|nr:hypothetical protein [Brumimicrobium mesophilum]